MKNSILLTLAFLLSSCLEAQDFKKLGPGTDVKQFYHQQGINYYLGTEDNAGQVYVIHYDTVSSTFNFGKEYCQIRLQIYNGLTWLYSKPIKLYSLNAIDAPRVLDIKFAFNKIYLAGSFDSSENNLGAGLLCFDGSEWQSAGLQLMQTLPNYFEVKEIKVFDQQLLISGNFDSIPGVMVNGLLWFKSGVWQPIGLSAPYGFRNLSNNSNVFFTVQNDSLYAYNKNKIKPDSIEIGGQTLKKLAVFNNGSFEYRAHEATFIGGFASYNGNLAMLPSSLNLYVSELQIRNGMLWQTYTLPDSFYVTNYIGSYEKGGQLYLLFQNPAPAEIRVYQFNGSSVALYKAFKLASQYISLEFISNALPLLSGPFKEVQSGSFYEKHQHIIGLSFNPSSTLSGLTFFDDNGDQIRQSGESIAPFCKIYSKDNKLLCSSDKDGRYTIQFPLTSNFQFEAENELKYKSAFPFSIALSQDSNYSHDFGLVAPLKQDVAVYLTGSTANKAKQGFTTPYVLDIYNYSGQNKTVQLKVILASGISELQHLNYQAAPLDGRSFKTTVNLLANSSKRLNFTCVYAVDSFELGQQVLISSEILESDDVLENNRDTLSQRVVAAFDPNIKVAFPDKIVNYQKEIKYVIWFQNEGNDTALNVTVVDSFGSLFNLSQVVVGGSSHGNIRPEVKNNSLIWHFRNIYLPSKKQDSVNSIGFVSFRSKLTSDAVQGDTIYNKASIYFDYQKPVETNNSAVVIDDPISIPELPYAYAFRVYPNPNAGLFKYHLEGISEGFLELYNIHGQLLVRMPLETGGIGEIRLPDSLESGIYFVRLQGYSTVLAKLILLR